MNELKKCQLCKTINNSRLYKFYTKNGQLKHWVCSKCLKIKGKRVVQSELDNIPFAKERTNFFKRITPHSTFFFKKKYKRNFCSVGGEFLQFEENFASAEGEF